MKKHVTKMLMFLGVPMRMSLNLKEIEVSHMHNAADMLHFFLAGSSDCDTAA